MRFRRGILVFSVLATFSPLVFGGEKEGATKNPIEAPSPDGKYAFRFTTGSEAEGKAYDLISRKSGKVLVHVAESDPDPGPSARFSMKVLWRRDSKAFALTALLSKRGSEISVYLHEGVTFREVKLPELVAEIPESVKGGEKMSHFAEISSQSAKRWRKDGALVAEIETMQDGNGGSVTATRTVVLDFHRPGRAKVMKSTIKFSSEKP